jgi:hypothetical protein
MIPMFGTFEGLLYVSVTIVHTQICNKCQKNSFCLQY